MKKLSFLLVAILLVSLGCKTKSIELLSNVEYKKSLLPVAAFIKYLVDNERTATDRNIINDQVSIASGIAVSSAVNNRRGKEKKSGNDLDIDWSKNLIMMRFFASE